MLLLVVVCTRVLIMSHSNISGAGSAKPKPVPSTSATNGASEGNLLGEMDGPVATVPSSNVTNNNSGNGSVADLFGGSMSVAPSAANIMGGAAAQGPVASQMNDLFGPTPVVPSKPQAPLSTFPAMVPRTANGPSTAAALDLLSFSSPAPAQVSSAQNDVATPPPVAQARLISNNNNLMDLFSAPSSTPVTPSVVAVSVPPPLTPVAMTTPQFGSMWGSHSFEKRLSLPTRGQTFKDFLASLQAKVFFAPYILIDMNKLTHRVLVSLSI